MALVFFFALCMSIEKVETTRLKAKSKVLPEHVSESPLFADVESKFTDVETKETPWVMDILNKESGTFMDNAEQEKLKHYILAGKTAEVSHPTFILTAGISGSGKSAMKQFLPQFLNMPNSTMGPDTIIDIDPDDLMERTQMWKSLMDKHNQTGDPIPKDVTIKKLIATTAGKRSMRKIVFKFAKTFLKKVAFKKPLRHALWDSTCSTTNGFCSGLAAEALKAGFQNVVVLFVSSTLDCMYQRTASRSLKSGRFVGKDFIQARSEDMLAALDQLHSQVLEDTIGKSGKRVPCSHVGRVYVESSSSSCRVPYERVAYGGESCQDPRREDSVHFVTVYNDKCTRQCQDLHPLIK